MSSRRIYRRKSAASGNWAGGLLSVLLLNMAVLPCAMALQSEACSHCPPAEEHSAAGHHDHGHADDTSAGGEAVQSDCCDVDASSINSRSGELTFKAASDAISIAGTGTATAAVRATRWLIVAPGPPQKFGGPPPLHKLFCVYLK